MAGFEKKLWTRTLALFLALASAGQAAVASGAEYALRFGPPAVGRGGPNPVGLPPDIADTEFSFATRKGFEANASVTGLLVGSRAQAKWGGYVSLGGGVVLDANGMGPGVYGAFGTEFLCFWICMSLEYQKAMGIGPDGLIQPYAVRFGLALWTD